MAGTFLGKFGGLLGTLPVTSGRTFFVAPSSPYTFAGQTYEALDGNDGVHPSRALLTANRAWDLVTADVGDVICLLPGAHSTAASITADVAGVTMLGLPTGTGNPWRRRTSLTASVADEVINVTAAGVTIGWLHVIPVTEKVGIDFTANGDRLHIHDCSFDMYTPVVNTATKGIAASANTVSADDVVIERCTFRADGAQGPAIQLADAFNWSIKACEFRVVGAVTWATAVSLEGKTNNVGVMEGCTSLALQDAVITDVVTGADLNSPDSVAFIGNMFIGQTVAGDAPIDVFGAGDALLCENYLGSIGAGSGGALVIYTT